MTVTVLPVVRIGLYCTIWVISLVLLGHSAARIHHTEILSPCDPTDPSFDEGQCFFRFLDPVLAELIATSILVTLWSMFAVHAIYMRCDRLVIHTRAIECIALSMFWMMWFTGTAIVARFWGNSSLCYQNSQCSALTTLVVFAWVGWFILLLLLGLALVHTFAYRSWTDPMHGHFYYRDGFNPNPAQGPESRI